MSKELKPVISAIVLFALGIAFGFTFSNWQTRSLLEHMQRPPHERSRGLMEHMSENLKLSEEQKEQVSSIFAKHHEDMRKIHDECFPRGRKVREKVRLEIRKILTPEQQEKFDQIHEERKRHHRGPPHFGRHGRPEHHGPPPHKGPPGPPM